MTEVKGKKTMRDDDILGALADALLGSGSLAPTEVQEEWTVCIVDDRGGIKKYPMKSLAQAQATIREWNRAGWRPWVEDSKGEAFTLAKEPEGKN
jgi:hypothetical protein